MKQLFMVVGISFLMQACVAAPQKQDEKKADFSSRFSVEGIKQRREAEYAKKLAELNSKNPQVEAQKYIAKGDYFLLAHQSGRCGNTNIPGLTAQESQKIKCRLQQMDGMGDSIYGNNHLQYRITIKKYAGLFNKVMLPYCR